MTTVQTCLMTACCGLVLWGAVAAQALELPSSGAAQGKPNCFVSPDVRVIDGQRVIPFSGPLSAVLVPTDAAPACPLVGMVFDDQTTLLVDCLDSPEAVAAFLAMAGDHAIATVPTLTTEIAAPCPPPETETAIEDWRAMLFDAYQLEASVAVAALPECTDLFKIRNCRCPAGSDRPYPPCYLWP